MNSAVAVLLGLAMIAANLPFIFERILFVFPIKTPRKAFGWRLLELILLYGLVGLAGYLLEQKVEPPQHQDWEFYVVTGCMFAVMAFPGFIYRYLWRQHASTSKTSHLL